MKDLFSHYVSDVGTQLTGQRFHDFYNSVAITEMLLLWCGWSYFGRPLKLVIWWNICRHTQYVCICMQKKKKKKRVTFISTSVRWIQMFFCHAMSWRFAFWVFKPNKMNDPCVSDPSVSFNNLCLCLEIDRWVLRNTMSNRCIMCKRVYE